MSITAKATPHQKLSQTKLHRLNVNGVIIPNKITYYGNSTKPDNGLFPSTHAFSAKRAAR
jgi:hypothetical protein